MKLPTINSVITKGTNDYPSFSKMDAQGNQGDMTYNVQGANIQNQPLQQGMSNYSVKDSTNPMYDVTYDSENAKNYNQTPLQQNVPLQQNYNQQNYNQQNYNQQNYNQPNQNVSLENSSVGVRQSEFLDQQYCSEKTKYGEATNTNYGDRNLDKDYTSTGRNQFGQPNYNYAQPSGNKMYPHFPHHPHHPHFPHHPHYPAPGYAYQYGY